MSPSLPWAAFISIVHISIVHTTGSQILTPTEHLPLPSSPLAEARHTLAKLALLSPR